MKEIQRNALTYFEVDTVFDCIECMRCSPSVSVAPPTLTTAPAGTFSLFHAGGHHVTSWLIEFQSTKLINFHVSQLLNYFLCSVMLISSSSDHRTKKKLLFSHSICFLAFWLRQEPKVLRCRPCVRHFMLKSTLEEFKRAS